MAEPTDLTASQLAAAYSSGELSPVEVTEAVLAAIAERDTDINAFCLVDDEAALAQARESEGRWAANQANGLLDGVPIAEGLPIGLQITGPRYSDALVLAVGRLGEQVLGVR